MTRFKAKYTFKNDQVFRLFYSWYVNEDEHNKRNQMPHMLPCFLLHLKWKYGPSMKVWSVFWRGLGRQNTDHTLTKKKMLCTMVLRRPTVPWRADPTWSNCVPRFSNKLVDWSISPPIPENLEKSFKIWKNHKKSSKINYFDFP